MAALSLVGAMVGGVIACVSVRISVHPAGFEHGGGSMVGMGLARVIDELSVVGFGTLCGAILGAMIGGFLGTRDDQPPEREG